MPLPLTTAFARYGAKLKNTRWSVSAIADDGALVLSCWHQFFETIEGGGMRYRDVLSRWSDANPTGSGLCREHLKAAFDEGLPVRLVIATAENEALVEAGNATNAKTKFQVRPTHVGRVVAFDGDELVVEFKRSST